VSLSLVCVPLNLHVSVCVSQCVFVSVCVSAERPSLGLFLREGRHLHVCTDMSGMGRGKEEAW